MPDYRQADLDEARGHAPNEGPKRQERIALALADRERSGRDHVIDKLREYADWHESGGELVQAAALRAAIDRLTSMRGRLRVVESQSGELEEVQGG